MLTENTRRALSVSRSVGAAPDGRVLAARRRLGMPNVEKLTVPRARQLALGDGIRSVVAGSLKRMDAGYALSLRLISASSGDVLTSAGQTGVHPDHLIEALDTFDGGMTASDYTMQFIADILAAPVDRPVFMETTALGAAYLAGRKAGVCPDLDGFAATWRLDRKFEPRMDEETRAQKWSGWQEAVRRTLTRR